MKNKKIVIISSFFGLSLLLTGVYQYQQSLDVAHVVKAGKGANFEAYLKFKRIKPKNENHRNNIEDRYMERAALADAIRKQDILDQSLIDVELDEFYKEMIISRYFEKYLNDKVTDQAVQNYYSANIKTYQERKAHVAHVLLRTNKNMAETERKVKLTTAQAAFSKASAGTSFSVVTKNFSEDAVSAKKAGDIGWIKEGAIAPSFSDEVFSMKVGEISKPVESPFGFHVIKLLEGPLVTTRPFDAVKGDIRYQLRNKAKQAELNRLIAKVSH